MIFGTIYSGIATPTEAAGMGAFGSLLASATYGRLNWRNLKEAISGSLKTSAMALWIVIGAYCFCSIYSASGAKDLIIEILIELPVNRYIVIIAMQLILVVLGMFLDPIGVIMIATPVFLPIIKELGFSPLWFGILLTMNLEMAYLTPPLGFNLFFLKGVTPPEIQMGDIYSSITPFVILQAIGLSAVMIFPQIAMWLPGTMK